MSHNNNILHSMKYKINVELTKKIIIIQAVLNVFQGIIIVL